ncbi:ATP-binding protein [Dendronalium sp. ChiSLP03b]|uniref:ATP-binding protein n=1 Tax=Dendronalium sp. ChiSLP03b TaxID=3075381 RepID=UPI002AD3287B|nr:ATP-binding protein [Dendronalium sp. ChiSLP03b]MDZ8208197.1 ATP-binding protein [Dendronalium sp. ChiSLP03b]
MSSPQFNIPPQLFNQAFPFHIVFNRERKILQVGEVLQRVHPEPLLGKLIEQHFQIKRPNIQIDFTAIAKRLDSLFLFESLDNGILLKGQMMYIPEQDVMLFLCSVWVNDLTAISDYNLKLKDFAMHDQTVDLIFTIKAKNNALEDIKKLTDELIQRQSELEKALQVQESLAKIAATQAQDLEQALKELQQTQSQLIQTEKMSSLGQLLAGVGHEINNPVNFIYGNLKYINEYTQNLLSLIKLYQKIYQQDSIQIQALLNTFDLEFIIEDLPKILSSMEFGASRICEIVKTLRNFSRLDRAEMKLVDIHEGIDSTLLILQHRLQAKSQQQSIEVIKEYSDIPLVECYAGQMNQVFMNILNNAIDALHQHDQNRSQEEIQQNPSRIIIRTQVQNRQRLLISIKDNGSGITEKVRTKLFDPFFTTKPVGKGTGLGLSISYQIVVDKHGGKLECISTPKEGAEFVIEIPLRQLS